MYVASPDVLTATVGFNLHRGAVAAADRRPLPSLSDVLVGARCVAVLEGLNDAENLGAIARSARALGVDALVLDPTCIDPYYRRIVRVSMGEVLLLPIARATRWPGDLDTIRAAGFALLALTPDPAAEDLVGPGRAWPGGADARRRGTRIVERGPRRRRPAGADPDRPCGRLAQRRARGGDRLRRPHSLWSRNWLTVHAIS